NLEKEDGRLSRATTIGFAEVARVESRRTGAGLSRDHFISFRHELGNGEFLAGLVRDHSAVGRLDYGFSGCLAHRDATRSLLGDLCERSGRAWRESADQGLHRIHFGDSVRCARIFWNRGGWPGNPHFVANAVHEMGAVFP